jgi:serine/threonine protein kinase/Tfp pilus assembly protein PilF/TolB-like protein
MDEKWQKVREVFDAALLRQPEERPRFIVEACGADKTLCAEVESLLSSLGSADSFLETPAASKVADIIKPESPSLANGTSFSHYEIIREIGRGGMGEVYLAKDTNLNRKVALKLLAAHITEDKNRVSRFRQEAFATSALNHPNIVTIYEIGKWQDRDFIVTEFIGGVTLRAWLRKRKTSVGEALDVALQIASALAAAHGAGIVHRDIKPENIMIREDGLVKVLDFGIAKYRPTEKGQKALIETEIGEIIGTAAYMSPEQARGLGIDAQTDIWSLGVILYEMLTGKLPFEGDTKSDRLAAILERDPAPLAKTGGKVSSRLQQIIDRALAKEKKRRYNDIAAMAEDLHGLRETTGDKMSPLILPWRRSAAARRTYLLAAVSLLVLITGAIGLWFYYSNPGKTVAGDKKTIAVLPLKPINQANRDELYEIGVADSLIQRISTVKGFVVRPLSAIRKYADLEQDPIAAGREQQVDYVLASNYQIANGKIRVTAQLFNVETGQIEDTYKDEKDASDVFAMQDAIGEGVGKFLQSHFAVASGTPAATRGTDNEEAYRLYLQGMYFYDRRTRPDAHKAVEVLEQAVRLDPNYARAWAGLAHAHSYLINLGGVNIDIHEQRRISMEAVNKALALDKNVSEAYSALCDNKMYYEYDFAGAETACRRAIELKPGSPLAHNTYGRFLMSRGRFDEAVSELKTAIEFEPTSYFHQIVHLTCLAQARRYDEAARHMDRLAELNPGNAFRLYWQNAGALMTQENPPQAFERWMKYLKLTNPGEQTLQLYQTIYQTAGWQGVMREQARKNKENPMEHMFLIAAIHAQIGDKDSAMEFLEKSYQRREFWMAHLKVEPRLDSLRGDPRFEELLRRVESKPLS